MTGPVLVFFLGGEVIRKGRRSGEGIGKGRDLADISNGVKFGQSTVFNSGQCSADIQNIWKVHLRL